MKKNLTKIWMLLSTVVLGSLLAACSSSDGGDGTPPAGDKVTVTIHAAVPYEELGIKNNTVNLLNGNSDYSLSGTVLLYDPQGNLQYSSTQSFRKMGDTSIDISNVGEGIYTIIYYQTGTYQGKFQWKLTGNDKLSTVQLGLPDNDTSLEEISALCMASATITVGAEGGAQLTLTPKAVGSIVSMQMVRNASMNGKVLAVDLHERPCAIRLNPALGDADRFIYHTDDTDSPRLSFLYENEDTYNYFFLTSNSHTYQAQLTARNDDGPQWIWDADLTPWQDITLQQGKHYVYYFDGTKDSDNFFFGLQNDFTIWKATH